MDFYGVVLGSGCYQYATLFILYYFYIKDKSTMYFYTLGMFVTLFIIIIA